MVGQRQGFTSIEMKDIKWWKAVLKEIKHHQSREMANDPSAGKLVKTAEQFNKTELPLTGDFLHEIIFKLVSNLLYLGNILQNLKMDISWTFMIIQHGFSTKYFHEITEVNTTAKCTEYEDEES